MADMGWRVELSRRSLLRYTAVSAGLLTLARLRSVPAIAAVGAPAEPLQALSARDADILTAIVERMVFTGAPDMPAVRDTRAIDTIDQALLQLDDGVQSQLRWLLVAFEWGPPFFQLKLTTFTRMSAEERDAYLEQWATSAVGVRRLAFRALKNLSMLGYYSQDATWKAIHYDGPWTPRPRRAVTRNA